MSLNCGLKLHTLHPESNLSRHDGLRSFVWVFIVVVVIALVGAVVAAASAADTGAMFDDVIDAALDRLSTDLWTMSAVAFSASRFDADDSRPALSSVPLLLSVALLPLAVSWSPLDKSFCVAVACSSLAAFTLALSFLSSSVMPKP